MERGSRRRIFHVGFNFQIKDAGGELETFSNVALAPISCAGTHNAPHSAASCDPVGEIGADSICSFSHDSLGGRQAS